MKIYAAFGLQVGETLTCFIEGRLQMQLYAGRMLAPDHGTGRSWTMRSMTTRRCGGALP